jgi:Predicted permeases
VEGVEAPASDPAGAEPRPRVEFGPTELSGAVTGGAVIGVLKGAFGVGAGFLIVPLMVSVGRIPRPVAVTNSLFAILVASLAGSLLHLFLGNVDWVGLAWLVPGGLFGSFVGARAARSMSPAAIRRLFLAVMGASSIYLIALTSSYK